MRKYYVLVCLLLGIVFSSTELTAQDAPFPTDSKLAKAEGKVQRILINPLEQNSILAKYAYLMKEKSDRVSDIEAKVGNVAVLAHGIAKSKGSKGDFVLARNIPGKVKVLGMWVHIAKNANAKKVGMQISDAKGEALMATFDADFTGWKWVDFEVGSGAFKQAYSQPKHDSKIDMPLKQISFVWFTDRPGDTGVTIDGLACATELEGSPAKPMDISLWGGSYSEKPGGKYKRVLTVTNFTGKEMNTTVDFSLQEDAWLYNKTLPHAVKGSDHAADAKSWTVVNGKKLSDSTLTDGDSSTASNTSYKKNGYKEALQYIDLGQEREVTFIDYTSGDANWINFAEFSISSDGKNYKPIEGLENVDMHKKWGANSIALIKPAKGKFLRIKYHKNGEAVNVIRMPVDMKVYDGIADEKWEIPEVGRLVENANHKIQVSPNSFTVLKINGKQKLDTGAYLAGMKISYNNNTSVDYHHFFVMPKEIAISDKSRFGMNVSLPKYAKLNRKLGVGWVRFENMKWAFVNPKKDYFAFDGSVAPWHVPQDEYIEKFTNMGFSYLPYVFVTPDWATTAPKGTKKNAFGYPPKDYADYGELMFQLCARYGSKKHPENVLKTKKKISGLNQIKVVELWNEPNLNAPSWGPFVGSLKDYVELFRAGAEGVKRADPNMQISNGGYAGLELDLVDFFRTYKYADGKTPLDFIDILNVHVYTGKVNPEVCTDDPNVNRSGKPSLSARTYDNDLRSLAAWRDTFKPGTEIWITETGYDVGGPMGRDERYQAAKLPRCIMMALANNIDKVFIYREKGSTPSKHAGSGLIRNDDTVRPSWFTVATMIRQLDGVKGGALRLDTGDKNVWVYLWNTPRGKVLSAWTVKGNAKLNIDLGKCTLSDAFGLKTTKTVDKDFKLGIFPYYFTGFNSTPELEKIIKLARKKESQWQDYQKKASAKKVYIYDFGLANKVGSLKDFGAIRQYQPVSLKDTYTKGKGFGFSDGTRGRDENYKWVADYLEGDSVHLDNGGEFLVDLDPGTYNITQRVELFKTNKGDILLQPSGADEQSFALKSGVDTIKGKFTTDGGLCKIVFPKSSKVLWLNILPEIK